MAASFLPVAHDMVSPAMRERLALMILAAPEPDVLAAFAYGIALICKSPGRDMEATITNVGAVAAAIYADLPDPPAAPVQAREITQWLVNA